jgi:hypothetical protein
MTTSPRSIVAPGAADRWSAAPEGRAFTCYAYVSR